MHTLLLQNQLKYLALDIENNVQCLMFQSNGMLHRKFFFFFATIKTYDQTLQHFLHSAATTYSWHLFPIFCFQFFPTLCYCSNQTCQVLYDRVVLHSVKFSVPSTKNKSHEFNCRAFHICVTDSQQQGC